MKNVFYLITLSALILFSFVATDSKLVSYKNHIQFFSHTDIEDILAENVNNSSTLDKNTGEVVFSVPMQSFNFKKALMQKHFNSKDFLDTKQFPKSKLVAKIDNFKEVNLTKDGTYNITFSGDMTIKGVTKKINEKATLVVTGGVIKVHSKFRLLLADYGVVFEKGKPASNIAKEVEVTVDADYKE